MEDFKKLMISLASTEEKPYLLLTENKSCNRIINTCNAIENEFYAPDAERWELYINYKFT